MRRIELTFFLVGIDRERLQEILIDTPYQVFLMEALFTDFVDFVNKCFERFPFNAGLRKKLHRERVSKTFDRRVEIRNHQIDGERQSGAVSREKHFPATLFRQIGYSE